MQSSLFTPDDRLQVFQTKEQDAAIAHAAAGGIAVHLHSIVFPHSPQCFRRAVARGEQIAHVFGQDAAELEKLAKHHGVRVIYIDKPGTPRQHIDMCCAPLRSLLDEIGAKP